MSAPLRVALFACSFHEVDGVANTCRHFESFARRRSLPFMSIFGGNSSRVEQDGSAVRYEVRRRWPKFRLDEKHDYDLLLWRYYPQVAEAVRSFRPDVIHITGPSDIGQLGALVAHRLHIPLVASWHTNVHEYAARRFLNVTRWLPDALRHPLSPRIEEFCFQASARFFQIARLLFAPNRELVNRLESATGKPCHLMTRGVDTDLFCPGRRRSVDPRFTIGYVGRLTTEKNIHFLKDLEGALLARGLRNFRLLVVGQGAEENWLRAHLTQAEFAGVLGGEALARAYADMDLFVFPSRTDTFGNVVLEAMASGVPAVVTDGGGPKYIVRNGINGFVTAGDAEFIEAVARLLEAPRELTALRREARLHALHQSWDAVFERLYQGYEQVLTAPQPAHRGPGVLNPVRP